MRNVINRFLRIFDFILQAIELDDSDVYTVNRLGQIALKLEHLDIAQMAFEKVNHSVSHNLKLNLCNGKTFLLKH